MTPSLLLIILACTPDAPTDEGGPVLADQPTQTGPSVSKAEHRPETGWGAVFWRHATPWKVGGGSIVVGPKAAATVRTGGEALTCNGLATKSAPPHGAVVLPEGASMPIVPPTPAIQAHRVERAAWRLDEVLPARGRFSSSATSISPSQQRGVEVGSVTKTRRRGAPPFLIATGVRDCTGAVAITDLKAERVLVYDTLSENCKPLRVLPAVDYDGDGQREFSVFNDERVAIYRLIERPGELSMTRLAEFRCKDDS
jgi:hypothetical protein